jgi:hypothetical protein
MLDAACCTMIQEVLALVYLVVVIIVGTPCAYSNIYITEIKLKNALF